MQRCVAERKLRFPAQLVEHRVRRLCVVEQHTKAPSGATIDTFSGIPNPIDVAVDGAGTPFVASHDSVLRIEPSGAFAGSPRLSGEEIVKRGGRPPPQGLSPGGNRQRRR